MCITAPTVSTPNYFLDKWLIQSTQMSNNAHIFIILLLHYIHISLGVSMPIVSLYAIVCAFTLIFHVPSQFVLLSFFFGVSILFVCLSLHLELTTFSMLIRCLRKYVIQYVFEHTNVHRIKLFFPNF